MRVQAGFLTLSSVLRGVTAIYDLPDVPSSHDQQFIDIFNTVRSDVLKRSTHDESFSLNFNVANQVLSSGYVVPKNFSYHTFASRVDLYHSMTVMKDSLANGQCL